MNSRLTFLAIIMSASVLGGCGTNEYETLWLNYDESVLYKGTCKFGEIPVYEGPIPVKPNDENWSYIFSGWDPKVTYINSDTIYRAQYATDVLKYKIEFKNIDGTILDTEYVQKGMKPVYSGDDPSYPFTDGEEHIFAGWDPQISIATSDCTYTAKFSKPSPIEFWSCFNSQYTSYLNNIVSDISSSTGYDINHVSKGSYDGIKTAVSSSLATGDYPNLMTGYPDHFASYLGNKILVQLNPYIDAWNKVHPEIGGGLLADYYADYMVENQSLDIYKHDDVVDQAVSALPFSKATEVMSYNGVFVDYCATINLELANIPTTWQQWKIQGPKYRDIYLSLVKITDDRDPSIIKQQGVVMLFDQDEEGRASNFELIRAAKGSDVDKKGKAYLDFTEVDSKGSRIISWDSTDNMFITLLRQWGSSYTELPESEKTKDPRRRKGHITFNSAANKEATLACLKYFNEMNTDKVFGVPTTFGASYSSDAFAANKVMFVLCSSGGLSYNTDSWNQRLRVAPVPYYDDGSVVRKFVMSRGVNIALSNQGDKDAIERGFNILTKLTSGKNQAVWCVDTGFYPCTKSAVSESVYQNFLNDKSFDNKAKVVNRESAILNQNHYMNTNKNWVKFVDPAFASSSKVRTEVKAIFEEVFQNVVLDPETYEPSSKATKTYQGILDYVCKQFENDTSVVVDR